MGGECYLLVTSASAVLIDSGFDFCADKAVENIRNALGTRRLDLILLTHSHYDHAAIRAAFPGCRVVASRHAGEVFKKPNALRLMRSLDSDFAKQKGCSVRDRVGGLRVDVPVDDGDVIQLEDMSIRAVATPGHTRCCTSYFFEELRFLVCSETLGVITRYPEVAPCLIIGYRITLDSVERSRVLGAKRLLVSHSGLIPAADTNRFFDMVTLSTNEAVALLVRKHSEGCDEEEMAEAFMDRFYDDFRGVQPEQAFAINTRALIPRVLAELGLAPNRSAKGA